jgi:pimeloyl-ACP methyl ester carboxylesterase
MPPARERCGMKSKAAATPIIFVHGAFCGGWAFNEFREPFETAGFETHAPNLPYHERGADHDLLARCSVRDYADAIGKYARDLAAPPVLIGHSLGGLVVQLAAMQTPTAALVLLAASPPWGVVPATLDEHGNSLGLSLLGDYWRRAIPADYRTARGNTLDRLPREQARRAFGRFTAESGRAIRETMHWWLDHSMASAAPVYRIDCPVLGIGGGCDRINSSPTVRRIINRFPAGQAQFHEFPEMSHWVIGEPEWENVAGLTLNWLASRGVGPAIAQKPRRMLGLFNIGEARAEA